MAGLKIITKHLIFLECIKKVPIKINVSFVKLLKKLPEVMSKLNAMEVMRQPKVRETRKTSPSWS